MMLPVILLTTAADWPTYQHDPQRSGSNAGETIISPANAASLTTLWTFDTGSVIAASATVVDGTVYIGSWDGYEYALDAATGALKWKTYLGITIVPNCAPSRAGVTSAAAVQGGVVYVGGGDAYWYALDAASGAVLWKVFTGDNSQTGGHYNWSSPLLANGYAYIGIASEGDCPLVQGQLLQVDLATHAVVHTFNAVPDGQIGGGIWTSPTLDAVSNTIYVTTGTEDNGAQIYPQSVIALDAASLAVKDAWHLPPAQAVFDSDWGDTPIIFNDAAGHNLVAAANKNGYFYAFDRANLSAGPLWERQVANGGPYPVRGDGTVSSPAFGNGTLFMAGGNTTIGGVPYKGSVRALDPATGNFLWEHGSPGTIIPALAYANGLVIDGAGPTLEVLNAATGAMLYSYRTGAVFYGAPSVANGRIYAGSADGKLYAFGLPNASATATPTGIPVASAGGQSGSLDLSGYYNNAGISSDSNGSLANFDGQDFSFSREALQSVGIAAGQPVIIHGVAFSWPNSSPGSNDNVVASGQIITPTMALTGTTLALLGAGSGGTPLGTGTITYTDGSTQRFDLGMSDWTLNGSTAAPSYGNSVVATMTHRNTRYDGLDPVHTYVFYDGIALQGSSGVASITLPTTVNQGRLHIFALNVSTPTGQSPPGSTATATQTSPTVSSSTATVAVPGSPTDTATATVSSSPTSTATATATTIATNMPSASASSTATATATATVSATATVPALGGSIDLTGLANNAGISSDANMGAANFDGGGYSYSREALQAAGVAPGGVVTAGGVAFRWPAAAAGAPDNVVAAGQTVALPAAASGSELAVLGSASGGPSQGLGTLTYADGSTQAFALGLSDWTLNGGAAAPGPGSALAASSGYRNYRDGIRNTVQADLLVATVALQPGKALASVTLPAGADRGKLHIFAMSVASPAGLPTPTATATATATASATATVAPPGGSIDLTGLANNAGISSDANMGAANFDGGGYSYSREALQAAGVAPGGVVTAGGVAFRWPAAAAGAPDNVVAAGQTVALPAAASGSELAVLGSASGGPSQGFGHADLRGRQHPGLRAGPERLDPQRRRGGPRPRQRPRGEQRLPELPRRDQEHGAGRPARGHGGPAARQGPGQRHPPRRRRPRPAAHLRDERGLPHGVADARRNANVEHAISQHHANLHRSGSDGHGDQRHHAYAHPNHHPRAYYGYTGSGDAGRPGLAV